MQQESSKERIPDFLEVIPGEVPEGRMTRLPSRGDVDQRIRRHPRAAHHRNRDPVIRGRRAEGGKRTSRFSPPSAFRLPPLDEGGVRPCGSSGANLELPNRVAADRATLSDTYGKFVAEPFERGFGITIGNGLRRVLLSSLEGSAVTKIKIENVQHEISTISGVVEDVTDIVLNVKSLVLKNLSDHPQVIRIVRAREGAGQGGRHPARFGNPDHQPRTHHRHPDGRRPADPGDDGRERPGLPHGRR